MLTVTEDLVAGFEGLLERSKDDDAEVRSCLGLILERAERFYDDHDASIEEHALVLARIVLLESLESKAATILEYAAILADSVLSEAEWCEVELPPFIREGLEQVRGLAPWDTYIKPEATAANQGGQP
jgi:hypothetical protein